jgi:hypothetical protein
MLSKTSSKVIERYITSIMMAITTIKCISSRSRIKVIRHEGNKDISQSSLPKEAISVGEVLQLNALRMPQMVSPWDVVTRWSRNATKAHLKMWRHATHWMSQWLALLSSRFHIMQDATIHYGTLEGGHWTLTSLAQSPRLNWRLQRIANKAPQSHKG